MDKDIKKIVITQTKNKFIVEIFYTNDKQATFPVDGLDLELVLDAINQQNNEVHRA